MGLFGKKLELKKEYFDSYSNLNADQICDLRTRQGFNVSTCMDQGALEIRAEMKHFLGSFLVVNKIHVFGMRACEYHFYETFSFTEVTRFLDQYFRKVPQNVTFHLPNGDTAIAFCAYYLPDGNLLYRYKFQRDRWFSFKTIPKDQIIQ